MRLINIPKKTLEKLYLEDKKSTNEIGKLYNVYGSCIYKKMIKYKIPMRNYSDASLIREKNLKQKKKKKFQSQNVVKLNKQEKDILDGLILSDGYISIGGKYTKRYQQCAKYEEFLIHIKKILPLGYSDNSIHKVVIDGGFNNGKIYEAYNLKSLSSLYMLKERKRWYLNRTKKIPKDFVLTKISLLYWFLGDGNFSCGNLRLYPLNFGLQEIQLLKNQLLDLGIESIITRLGKNKTQYFIRIRNKSVKFFFDLIGDSPIKCYKYKWGSI